MIISCKYCKTTLRIDRSLVKTDGSKVKCAKCNDIIMVYLPKNNTGSRIHGRNATTERTASNIESELPDNHPADHIETTDNLKEVDKDFEYAELPDLPEIEEIVDSLLDEKDHLSTISPFILNKYSLSEDLNFSVE